MPTLDDVYRKFGEASEAAQLLETELGNLLLLAGIVEADLIGNPEKARPFLENINRATLGQLVARLKAGSPESVAHLEGLLARALKERNRLSHSFYREHNFRRNSDDGRALMLQDLEGIHTALLDAYKFLMLLSGVDLDKLTADRLPTRHLPL